MLSGMSPQISVISAKNSSQIPNSSLSDFIFMTRREEDELRNVESMICPIPDNSNQKDKLKSFSPKNSSTAVDAEFDNDYKLFTSLRVFLSYITHPKVDQFIEPSLFERIGQVNINDDHNTMSSIVGILDVDSFFELMSHYGTNFIVGFGRIKGYAVGLLAIHSITNEEIPGKGLVKFVNFCNVHDIPLVTFSMGHLISVEQLRQAFSESTNLKILILTRESKNPHLLLNDLKCQFNFKWSAKQFDEECDGTNVFTANSLSEPNHISRDSFYLIHPNDTRKSISKAIETNYF